APEQVRILSLSNENVPYAREVLKHVREGKIRASLDESSEKLGAKIRRSELEKIPYMFIIGNQEQVDRKVSLRSRKDKSIEGIHGIACAIDLISKEIEEKRL
ncbi:MAG: hypothetical protein LBB11_02470, partial [Puniceicoccales bacterium]|nr:hypothetical protein [Puniceicoccales bacterium]